VPHSELSLLSLLESSRAAAKAVLASVGFNAVESLISYEFSPDKPWGVMWRYWDAGDFADAHKIECPRPISGKWLGLVHDDGACLIKLNMGCATDHSAVEHDGVHEPGSRQEGA